MEVLKSLKGDEDGFEVKDVSSNKMRNVANAYAWWVAKDCVALSIFKVRFGDHSNIRVTEPLQLSARGFYRTEAPNTRFPLAFLSPTLRKQPVIGPYFER